MILLDWLNGSRAPESMSATETDLLIRQARNSRLLSHLAQHIRPESLAPGPDRHLASARLLAAAHRRSIRWELHCIAEALGEVDFPVVLLKGAAYQAIDTPNSRGRLFGDVDLMVPRDYLPLVEDRLRFGGWLSTHHDDYDARYYREWMHEIPPLKHMRRQTVIDLHHTITPPTSRFSVDAEALFAAAVPLSDGQPFHVLSPADMVLHSAAHLFTEGEFDSGLRDLVDLRLLLDHFNQEDWLQQLAPRAQALQLTEPLYYALYLCRRLLHQDLGDGLQLEQACRPASVMTPLLLSLLEIALRPNHPSSRSKLSPLAEFMLYLRGHYLRMPLRLLIPHLLRKALMSEKEDEETRPEDLMPGKRAKEE